MTIFSDNPHDRRMERLMMTVPNFAPRGVGVRFSESQILITVTAATPTEILTATMRQIRCPPFRKRFNEYIESEETPMDNILTDMKNKNAELLVIPDISRLGRNTATVAGIVKAFADEGIDIEITADGSRPTEPFAPDAEPFIQEM